MSELSQEAKALLAEGRTTLSPSPDELRAVRNALASKLAAPAASVEAGRAAQLFGPTRTLLGKLLLSGLTLMAVGGALWAVMLDAPHAVQTQSAAARPSTMSAANVEQRPIAEPIVVARPLEAREQPASPAPSRGQVAGTARRHARPAVIEAATSLPQVQSETSDGMAQRAAEIAAPVPSTAVAAAPDRAELRKETKRAQEAPQPAQVTTADTLREETRLLREARRALEARHAARSVAFLDQHAERFPHGVLHEERLALRAIALCRLGQHAAAGTMIDELRRLYPSSPQLSPALAACTQPADR